MKSFCVIASILSASGIQLVSDKNIKKGDAFDQTIGGDDSLLSRGYDEINDYDKEAERPENVKWDDESWRGFKADFETLAQNDFTPVLNEK